MEKRSTLFLRIAVFLIGAPILALCIYILYELIQHPVNPVYAKYLYPIISGVLLSAFPFFTALYQALKLLGYIDKNEAFSDLSVQALKVIKFCAIAISVLYAVIWPFVIPVAKLDDAPGLAVFAMIPIFASMVIAVFAALLQRLLKEAINIKSENDLTI